MSYFDSIGLLTLLATIWLISDWFIRIGALFFVPRNRRPSSGTAWLVAIFFFPIGGLILYKLLGNYKLPKSRRNAQKTLDDIIKRTINDLRQKYPDQPALNPDIPPKYENIAKLSESLAHLPPLSGNKLKLLPDYQGAIDSIIHDIKNAKYYVHIEYFIIALDDTTEPLFTAMSEAQKRGVKVRVMYDWLSARRYPGFKKMIKRIKNDNIEFCGMLPLRFPGMKGYVRPDLRNHRKLVIIDNDIGYTGSQNLIRRNYHRKDELYYDEVVVKARGPVALELGAVFVTDWYSETNYLLTGEDLGIKERIISPHGNSVAQVLPSGPGYDDENNLKLFTQMIHTAQRQITITNPYFVPDEALTNAITSAARRGVTVRMINSQAKDQFLVGHAQRSFYQVLLEAGVKIYLYKTPILLHSKFITIDDDIATIGSSNLDMRSFMLNLEVTMISYDQKVVADLQAIEQKYLDRSIEIKLNDWLKRPRRKILLDNLARLTSALQ